MYLGNEHSSDGDATVIFLVKTFLVYIPQMGITFLRIHSETSAISMALVTSLTDVYNGITQLNSKCSVGSDGVPFILLSL